MILIESLNLNPANPRVIKDEKFKKLVASLRSFPQMMDLRPIVVDENNVIQGGNMRYRALCELGYKEIPEAWVKQGKDLTPDQWREFVIKDNVGFGEWDFDQLANEWNAEELQEWGLDLPVDFGGVPEAHEDDYEIPDEIETDIVVGDLFEIGTHRLLCGDSTIADNVNKLLENVVPILMVTDPPYGVIYDANWRNESDRANGRPIGGRATMKVNNDDRADWKESYSLFPGNVAYVWSSDLHVKTVIQDLESSGFLMVAQIIWAKNNIVIGRGDYHFKHEPCIYAVKKGKNHNWQGSRKENSLWEIDKPMKSETGHSTQKPILCMGKPIENNTAKGESVYDPFLGSGTTMVAAHQLNRKCYGMEIDPKYCQVIIDRMLKLDPTITITKNGNHYDTRKETNS